MTKSTAVLSLALGICVVVFLSSMFIHRSKREAVATNEAHPMNAEALERDVRASLPPGSSVATVEAYLQNRKMEFSFNSASKTAYAIMRKLDGSTTFASQSLSFQFHFDDDLKLKTIDTKVAYTGP